MSAFPVSNLTTTLCGTAWWSGHRRLLASDSRPWRVAVLLVTIVVLSLVDLVLTVGHMSTSGMFESNPLVTWLASHGAAPAIVQFKLLSVLIGVSLLYRMRHHASSEFGAWIMTAVLVWLTVRWGVYTSEVADIDPATMLALAQNDSGWVRLN